MKFELRAYQKNAVKAAIQHFRRETSPACLVLPTGAGKSLVIAELARIARGRVLVLAHVKELVEQNFQKYRSFDLPAGIYSAGLGLKQTSEKVIFGSVQSVVGADSDFFNGFSLVVIDECHRVSLDRHGQYGQVVHRLQKSGNRLCVLGLTATPYRLGLGWIYEIDATGEVLSQGDRFFKKCLFELSLDELIKQKHLTRPIKLDLPVTCYDFSELTEENRFYSADQIDHILKKQKRLTPLIIKNIIDITEQDQRKGVMIFAGSVNHAREILESLPEGQADIITGETPGAQRDQIIDQFKAQELKYLVNVSVLTTGFDAPHVDVIAILRPTESVALFQQIVGRGLRLSPGKKDCLILDYTGVGHDLYSPTVREKKVIESAVEVTVLCPQCGGENQFWGIVDQDGEVLEHFGRRCRQFVELEGVVQACGFLFRKKLCPSCQTENDVTARQCRNCKLTLVDADAKLKEAKLSKAVHVMRPEEMLFSQKQDRKGREYLEVRYFDQDSQSLSEVFYLTGAAGVKRFEINFLRGHMKRPEIECSIKDVNTIISKKDLFRMPKFILARKKDKFWQVTEKIFVEQLEGRSIELTQ